MSADIGVDDLPAPQVGWQRWPAPAKLNLFLRVVGRREDGMHRLQTLFQLLDWGDAVDLRLRSDGQIHRAAGAAGVEPESDLAVRAARLLQAEAGADPGEPRNSGPGVDIAIHKRVPLGGGFGGGSSDAATVLVALNALWRCGLDVDRLAALGQQLGADVPVFVRGNTAWAEGVGERLAPMALPERWFVLVDTGVHVSTRELFQAPELTRNAPPLKMADFVFDWAGQNAFTPLVRARSSRLAEALDALSGLGQGGMTGTGGGCFLLADTEADAWDKAAALAHLGSIRVVRGVSRSPLFDGDRVAAGQVGG